MELIDEIQRLAKIYEGKKNTILTEEATKNALIMPFITALGYNVFDPSEVIPEFTAEFGSGSGKKVDYAIVKDGNPIMLVEAKWCGSELDVSKEAQLLYYFNATSTVTVGILTNGIEYRFYSDLDKENVMDQKPFLQFNIKDINDHITKELKKFTKTAFKADEIVSTAEELKFTGAMKAFLSEQLLDPSEEFVKYMAKQVFEGVLKEKTREKFKVITKKAFTQFISDRVSDRLSSALLEEKEAAKPVIETPIPTEEKNKIVTTQDEIDGYNIIRAILRSKVGVKRITLKDTVNYCNILFDGKKLICRLHFNNPEKKTVVIFDCEKKEIRHSISELEEIYNYSDELISAVEYYLNPPIK